MIFFVLATPILLLMMGLVIESGRVFLDYRHMQAAADTAALVGAQDLPCK
jgi:Flp pilus assembly protein TadG